MSCNGRGCEYNRTLPYGGRGNDVTSRGVQKRDVIKKVVSFPNISLYQMAQKKRQMEKRHTQTTGALCLLPNGVGTPHYINDNEANGYVNAYIYGNHLLNY